MTSAVRGTESSDAQRKIASRMLKAAYAFAFAAILSGSAHAQGSHRAFDGEVHNNAFAISPDERTAIVSYGDSPDVVIYDLEAKNVRAVLNHFITPGNIVFESNGRFFYISDSTLGVVEKIDTASLKTIAVFHANPGAFGITFSKDERTLYVNNEAASIVWAFDLALERPFTLITAYSQPHQGARPLRDGSPLYVIDFRGDKIRVIDIAANQFSGEIPGFSGIRAISVTRDGKTIFAANSAANSIAVVDASSRSIIKQIPVGKDPYSVALSSDERFVYSGNLADNTLSVVALSSLQVVATISGFSELAQAIVFTRGFDAYVLYRDLRISRVGLPTNRVVYTIPTQASTEATSFRAIAGEIQ